MTTTSSPNHTLTEGYFRLSLQSDGIHDFDPETKTTTDRIPYNATESEMKMALEALENVGTVNVMRSTSGFGRYTWSLTFPGKMQKQQDARNRGNMPMLRVVWRDLDGNVVVKESRRGSSQPVMCSHSCTHIVDKLELSTGYMFRVRARVTQSLASSTWGPYSGASDPVFTSRMATFVPPAAPRLLSSSHNTINVRVSHPAHYHEVNFQYRALASNAWTNVPASNVRTGGGYAVASLIDLEQDATYETRARFASNGDAGAWSATGKHHTSPGPPRAPLNPPIVHSVADRAASVAWMAEWEDGGPHIIAGYDVQVHSIINGYDQWSPAQLDPLKPQVNSTVPRILLRASPEVQQISTRADEGSSITSGIFKISLNYGGCNDLRPEDKCVTQSLAHNESAQGMRAALESIRVIKKLRRVERKGPDAQGGYSWLVTFDEERLPGDIPMLTVFTETISKGATWSRAGGPVVVSEKRKGVRAIVQERDPEVRVYGLTPSTKYRFRVRARSAIDIVSEWGPSSEAILTDFDSDVEVESALKSAQTPITISGDGRVPPKIRDPHYIGGHGGGGNPDAKPGQDGQDGLVVFNAFVVGQAQPVTATYYFTGFKQQYTVPSVSKIAPGVNAPLDHVLIKVWGAGGGSGKTNHSYGGAGGFAQGVFKVIEGQTLDVYVGGGGGGSVSNEGGKGGYNGGGDGGNGNAGGGGGGGASGVAIPDELGQPRYFILAGGGGGHGASDYCCSHGGAGGGDSGGAHGLSARLETPVDVSTTEDRQNKAEYGDERDASGLNAYHQHHDHGYAPRADYTKLSQGGYGGNASHGGFLARVARTRMQQAASSAQV